MNKGITYLKIIINFIFFLLSILFITLVLPKILGFFWPFVIAWIIAMIADPLVRFLEKRVKILRKHSSAIIIALVLILVTTLTYLIMLILIKELILFAEDLPSIIESMQVQFNNVSDYIISISSKFPQSVQKIVNNFINETGNIFNEFFKDFNLKSILTAGTFVKGVVEGVVMVIITIIAAYFFIVNKNEIVETSKRLIPLTIRDGWQIIVDNFKTAMGGYFKAQFKIMLIVALIVFVGLLILDVQYAILLTLIIAIMDFLPVLGAGGVLWPWAIFDMISGNYYRAIGLGIIYIVVQIVRQVLQPKMVADSIGISPLSTLVFMYLGYKFYGVMGMIFGIPVGMVIVNLYRIGIFDKLIRGITIIVQDINEFIKY